MLPNLRSHKEYISFVDKHIPNVQIPKAHDDVPDKLKLLDLTPIRLLFMSLYSPRFGRPSFAPEDMMRTFIAMVLCGVSSPTDWVDDYLKDKSGFYAIISGFQPDVVYLDSKGHNYEYEYPQEVSSALKPLHLTAPMLNAGESFVALNSFSGTKKNI